MGMRRQNPALDRLELVSPAHYDVEVMSILGRGVEGSGCKLWERRFRAVSGVSQRGLVRRRAENHCRGTEAGKRHVRALCCDDIGKYGDESGWTTQHGK